MEKCANNAGLINKQIPNHLKIVYEPDCGSLSIQTEVNQRKHQNQEWSKRGRYILLDAGGGTCDVACHQMLGDFAVEEIFRPSGGPWGSKFIDDYFIELLHKIFSKNWIDQFKKEDPAAFIELAENFRFAKQTFWTTKIEVDLETMTKEQKILFFKDKWHSVQLPFDFCAFLDDKADEENCTVKQILQDVKICGVSGLFMLEDDYLKLNYFIWMNQLFDLIIEPIVNHVKHLLSSTIMKNTTNYICLVGGLCSSKYLQYIVKSTFGPESKYGLKLIIPTRPILSVVDGAARFGLMPGYIQARTLSKTYGNAIDPKLDVIDVNALPPDYLEANQYRCPHTNVLRVRNIFSIYARKNQRVHINDKPIIRKFKRFNIKQRKVRISIFASDEEHPKVITNKPIAKCTVVFPDNSTELSIIVEIYFNDTKIRVFAYPENSAENKLEMALDYKTGYADVESKDFTDDSKVQNVEIFDDKKAMIEQMVTMELGTRKVCTNACEAVKYRNINAAIEWLVASQTQEQEDEKHMQNEQKMEIYQPEKDKREMTASKQNDMIQK
eukprot:242076_1